MLRPGHFIALIVLALLTIGVVMVNSADMRVAALGPDHIAPSITARSVLLSRSTIYMGLALAALALGSAFPVRNIAARLSGSVPLLVLGSLTLIAFCALVYMPGLSKEINGANRWLRIPVPGLGDALSLQPSEIAKWGMLALLSVYAAGMGARLANFWLGLGPALLCLGALCVVIVKEDLGTGVLIFGVSCLLLLAGGARLWHFLLFAPMGILGVVYAILTSDYRMKRILAFRDPYADPEGIGYHTIQSLIAIANGEGWGRGLGHGLQKFGYLPEDRTDFIFCVICEELGLAGAALVCSLFTALVWCGYFILHNEKSTTLRLFALGVVATIGLQAVINLAVVTGLAPTKGIALPLLSSGGTGWILTSFCLGLIISIGRTQTAVDPAQSAPAPLPAAA